MTTDALRSGFVTVVGRPNVGKSTLINQILGTKVTITSPRPNTTRRSVRGVLHRPGYQAVFVDTPGLHRPRRVLNPHLLLNALLLLLGPFNLLVGNLRRLRRLPLLLLEQPLILGFLLSFRSRRRRRPRDSHRTRRRAVSWFATSGLAGCGSRSARLRTGSW